MANLNVVFRWVWVTVHPAHGVTPPQHGPVAGISLAVCETVYIRHCFFINTRHNYIENTALFMFDERIFCCLFVF